MTAPDPQRALAPPSTWRPWVPVAVLTAVTLLVVRWGARLNEEGVRLSADAAPFHGRWRPLELGQVLPAMVLAAVIVGVWPRVVERISARWLGVAGSAGSLAWASVLAITPGAERLWAPLASRFEYLPLARRIDDLGQFLRTYVERLPTYPTHVRGHPPGPVLAMWLLDRIGLGDRGVGIVVVTVAASAVAAVVVAVRRLADEATARRVAMFVPFAPAVVWWSSFDAALMGLVAWTTAAATFAVTSTRPAVRRLGGATAGLGAGAVVISTYGAVPLLAPVGAVLAWGLLRRVRDVTVVAVATSIVPVVALAAAGFWWLDGFTATRREYWAGAASFRPFGYFVVANLVVFAVAAGPAVVGSAVGAARRTVWLLSLIHISASFGSERAAGGRGSPAQAPRRTADAPDRASMSSRSGGRLGGLPRSWATITTTTALTAAACW